MGGGSEVFEVELAGILVPPGVSPAIWAKARGKSRGQMWRRENV